MNARKAPNASSSTDRARNRNRCQGQGSSSSTDRARNRDRCQGQGSLHLSVLHALQPSTHIISVAPPSPRGGPLTWSLVTAYRCACLKDLRRIATRPLHALDASALYSLRFCANSASVRQVSSVTTRTRMRWPKDIRKAMVSLSDPLDGGPRASESHDRQWRATHRTSSSPRCLAISRGLPRLRRLALGQRETLTDECPCCCDGCMRSPQAIPTHGRHASCRSVTSGYWRARRLQDPS